VCPGRGRESCGVYDGNHNTWVTVVVLCRGIDQRMSRPPRVLDACGCLVLCLLSGEQSASEQPGGMYQPSRQLLDSRVTFRHIFLGLHRVTWLRWNRASRECCTLLSVTCQGGRGAGKGKETGWLEDIEDSGSRIGLSLCHVGVPDEYSVSTLVVYCLVGSLASMVGR